MERKASFGQVQVPFQGYDGKRSLVYTEVLGFIVYKVVVMYYSALQVSQGASFSNCITACLGSYLVKCSQ